ncbi:glycosyltransferase family 25 protein [Hasllibacter sp. MH4015]|uniref:glycosyltransferase family 25 protein n=1 Tax=Hasllibacter sp. MH4015 TaxID=2854029 RepID=UPI001CD3309C|nr:glycosyltransferase family 25 protein [Hasllibacter sp. MH4015]
MSREQDTIPPIWPSFVINLAANTVRMDNVRGQFEAQGIEFERIEAVNGNALSVAEMRAAYDADANRRHARRDLVPAEIGCYLSHIEAWRRIATAAAPGGFVFEDDLDASPDLRRVMAALCDDGGSDWDVAKLFSYHPEASVIAERELAPGIQLAVPYRVPTCCLGYALTRAAATRLLDRSVPFFRPVDDDHKYFWENGLRFALTRPIPLQMGDQQTVTGTISQFRRNARGGGISRIWRNLRVQAAYHIALRWHRLRGVR